LFIVTSASIYIQNIELKICANAFLQSGMIILDDFQAKQLKNIDDTRGTPPKCH